MALSFPEYFQLRAEEMPFAVALKSGERQTTYAELLTRVRKIAASLLEAGLTPGDRALLVFGNRPSFVEAYLGCAYAGLIAVPTHPGLGWESAVQAGVATGTRTFLCDGTPATLSVAIKAWHHLGMPEHARFFKEDAIALDAPFPPADDWLGSAEKGLTKSLADAESALVILRSSGTTGAPKFIERSHSGFMAASKRFGELWGSGPNVRFAPISLVTHAAALGWGVHPVLCDGGTLVFPANRHPRTVLQTFLADRVEVAFLVPSQGRALLDEARRRNASVPSLRLLIFGGERLAPSLAHGLNEQLGASIRNTYGMSEGFCTATDPSSFDEIDAGSVGRPCMTDDEVRIVSDAGQPVLLGELGELHVRSRSCVTRYWGEQIGDNAAFGADGFFLTGDIVRPVSATGFAFVGRRRFLINRGGLKIMAEELEEHISHHPSVGTVAVTSFTNELGDERIAAFVEPRPSAGQVTLEELRAFLTSRGVGHLRQPDRLQIVNQLPHTSVGKLDRLALARLADCK